MWGQQPGPTTHTLALGLGPELGWEPASGATAVGRELSAGRQEGEPQVGTGLWGEEQGRGAGGQA